MSFDQNPVFRKAFVPWYDTEVVCIIVILFMFPVFLFGVAGMSVAMEYNTYYKYVWVPVFLITMSGGVIISTLFRLIKRYL